MRRAAGLSVPLDHAMTMQVYLPDLMYLRVDHAMTMQVYLPDLMYLRVAAAVRRLPA
jgi:hypothetical protein